MKQLRANQRKIHPYNLYCFSTTKMVTLPTQYWPMGMTLNDAHSESRTIELDFFIPKQLVADLVLVCSLSGIGYW